MSLKLNPKQPHLQYDLELKTLSNPIWRKNLKLNHCLQVNTADRKDRVDFIAKYFKEATKTHGGYAINFFLCEVG